MTRLQFFLTLIPLCWRFKKFPVSAVPAGKHVIVSGGSFLVNEPIYLHAGSRLTVKDCSLIIGPKGMIICGDFTADHMANIEFHGCEMDATRVSAGCATISLTSVEPVYS